MTPPDPGAPPRCLQELNPDAEFRRVPDSHGGGEIILAETEGGAVVVAPPWAALHAREGTRARSHFRFGWFAAADEGPDLDSPPQEEGLVTFGVLRGVPGLVPHAAFLRAIFLARAQHFTTMGLRLSGVDRETALDEVRMMRAEWSRTFPHDAWPLGDPAPEASDQMRLSEWLAGAFMRLVASLFIADAPHAALRARGEHPEAAESPTQGRSFGPGVALQGDDLVTLAIDFVVLRAADRDLSAAIGDRAVLACLVCGPEEEIVARARFDDTRGRSIVRLELPPGARSDPSLWIALMVEEDT